MKQLNPNQLSQVCGGNGGVIPPITRSSGSGGGDGVEPPKANAALLDWTYFHCK